MALLIAARARSALALCAAGLLAGLGHGYGFPVLTSQAVTRAPLELRGSAMSVLVALWEGAQLASTPAFGAIADALGDATMFSAAAVIATLGIAGWLLLERRAA